jgi:hypothetical protein
MINVRGAVGGMRIYGRNRSTDGKPVIKLSLSATYPTYPDLGSNPGRANYCLYCMQLVVHYYVEIINKRTNKITA